MQGVRAFDVVQVMLSLANVGQERLDAWNESMLEQARTASPELRAELDGKGKNRITAKSQR